MRPDGSRRGGETTSPRPLQTKRLLLPLLLVLKKWYPGRREGRRRRRMGSVGWLSLGLTTAIEPGPRSLGLWKAPEPPRLLRGQRTTSRPSCG